MIKRYSIVSVSQLYILLSMLVVFTVIIQCYSQADATSVPNSNIFDWQSGAVSAKLDSDRTPVVDYAERNHASACQHESVFVGSGQNREDVCLYQAKSYRLARVFHCIRNWYGSCDMDVYMAISFGNDSKLYRINSLDAGSGDYCWQVSVASNSLVKACNGYLDTIPDLPEQLTRTIGQNGTEYFYDSSATRNFSNGFARSFTVGAAAASENGTWVALEIQGVGLVRLDTRDNSVRMITKQVSKYGLGRDPSYDFSISNDGKYLAYGGLNVGSGVYTINPMCGAQNSRLRADWFANEFVFDECPQHDIIPILLSVNGGDAAGMRSATFPKFRNDGGQLDIFESPYRVRDGVGATWITLTAGGYTAPEQLDYLALGDSYSSGEGDIGKRPDGSDYYTKNGGQCDLSTRSYPFLLRFDLGIAQNAMQSVACSGAKIIPDYNGNQSNYRGQSGKKQKDMTDESVLKNFTPGQITQLEFVRKYHPKIITLTGGGNDVGFATMLEYCAYGSGDVGNYWKKLKEGFYGLATCSYAKKDSMVQKITLKQIQQQYDSVTKLLRKIHEFSPASKLYVIGYPSFVSKNTALCLNALELDSAERYTIDYFQQKLNQQLENAAEDSSNASYIDTFDALQGGRICEGSEYVTGADNTSNIDRWFHPNNLGHQKMAESIANQMKGEESEDQTLLFVDDSLLGIEYEGAVISAMFIKDSVVHSGRETVMSLDATTFQPQSTVQLTLHSDPIDLGTVMTDDNGAIDTTITLPMTVGAGFHVLTLEGKTYSGEPITVYQSVIVDPPDYMEGSEGKLPPSNTTPPLLRFSQTIQNNDLQYQHVDQLDTQNPIHNIEQNRINQVADNESTRKMTLKFINPGIVVISASILLLLIIPMLIYYKLLKRRYK